MFDTQLLPPLNHRGIMYTYSSIRCYFIHLLTFFYLFIFFFYSFLWDHKSHTCECLVLAAAGPGRAGLWSQYQFPLKCVMVVAEDETDDVWSLDLEINIILIK